MSVLSYEEMEMAKCMADPVYYLKTYGKIFDADKNELAPFSPYEYQERVIKKFDKYQNNIILKSRQCVPKGVYVDTPSGPKAIEDFKVGDKVYSYNLKKGQIEEDVVYDAWRSGYRPCVKLKLKDTRIVEVGENHPFYIKEKGWVKAKNIQLNDQILDSNLGFGDISPSPHEIKLLAYLITDGTTVKQVKFTNNNSLYIKEFIESSQEVFSTLKIREVVKGNGYDIFPHQDHGVSTKNPIMEWCESKGIAGHTLDKLLPSEVFNWNKESVSLLINRMFAGDGWISVLKRKDNKRLELGIASPSKLFLEQIKMLLKKYSIKCNIYESKGMRLQKNAFFKLRITHSKSVSRFINEIGIYDKIREDHIEIISNSKYDVKDIPVVRKIEYTEEKECFDISVEKNENFMINGLLVHNTGLSVATAGFVAWSALFKHDQKILIIANDFKGAKRFLETVKQYINNTPDFLLPQSRLKDNQNELKFSNGSQIQAVASSPEAGRGESLTMLVLDEAAFIEHAEQINMGAGLAISRTGGKTIIISTPNGTSGYYYKTWQSSIKGQNKFVRSVVHWKDNPYCNRNMEIRTQEDGTTRYWSPWYEDMCEQLHRDEVKIAQELDLSFEGSKATVISEKTRKYYAQKTQNTKPKYYFDHKIHKDGGDPFVSKKNTFWVYHKPVENGEYIITCDVARGDGKDYSTIQIFEAIDMIQVAEYHKKIDAHDFAHVVFAAAKAYNNAYVAIEFNNMGSATCYELHKNLGYKRVYKAKAYRDTWTGPRDSRFKVVENEVVPGFQTTSKTRPLMINALKKYLNEKVVTLYSPRVVVEMETFVYKKDNKAEHEAGSNDDLLLALAIACYIKEYEWERAVEGKNLYKAMLGAISYSQNDYSGRVTETEKQQHKKKKKILEDEMKTKLKPIYLSKDPATEAAEEDSDLSWLLDN